MKILLVEDDTETAKYVVQGLEEAGHLAAVAGNGRDGLFRASGEDWDLLIVDRMLPGLDGMAVVRTLRGAGNVTPVLFLTTLGGIDDRVQGLNAGADDYLVKPFAYSELLARIRVILRRHAPPAVEADATTLELGDLRLELLKHRAFRGDDRLDLTPKEFALLSLLLRRMGEVLSRTVIAEQVWDMNFDSDTNVVDVAVRRLRTKLDDPYDVKLLHTVRGAGYVLELRP
jgi:two-component system copper resistance phosphate regulon response regulator CusR